MAALAALTSDCEQPVLLAPLPGSDLQAYAMFKRGCFQLHSFRLQSLSFRTGAAPQNEPWHHHALYSCAAMWDVIQADFKSKRRRHCMGWRTTVQADL